MYIYTRARVVTKKFSTIFRESCICTRIFAIRTFEPGTANIEPRYYHIFRHIFTETNFAFCDNYKSYSSHNSMPNITDRKKLAIRKMYLC